MSEWGWVREDDGRTPNHTDGISYAVSLSQYESNSSPITVNMNWDVEFNKTRRQGVYRARQQLIVNTEPFYILNA